MQLIRDLYLGYSTWVSRQRARRQGRVVVDATVILNLTNPDGTRALSVIGTGTDLDVLAAARDIDQVMTPFIAPREVNGL